MVMEIQLVRLLPIRRLQAIPVFEGNQNSHLAFDWLPDIYDRQRASRACEVRASLLSRQAEYLGSKSIAYMCAVHQQY